MQPVATLAAPSPVTYCRLGRDGARLFITRAGDDGSFVAEVWDVPANRLLFAVPREANPAPCYYEASSDMRLVATASCAKDTSPTLAVWDVTSGSKAHAWPSGHAPLQSPSMPSLFGIYDLAFSADGTRLATAGVDGTVRVWDTATGQAQFILTGHSGEVEVAGFSPDGQRLATGGIDNTARIWDLAPGPTAGKEIVRIEQDSLTEAVAFSPDGGELATGTLAGSIVLWDASDGRRLLSLPGSPGEIYYLVFSPDGTRLFSQAYDYVTRLWDLSPDRELLTLLAPTAMPVFSPDGTTLAAGTSDGRALLWDSRSGELLHSLAGHSDLTFVAFSPDGKPAVHHQLGRHGQGVGCPLGRRAAGAARLWRQALVPRVQSRWA